MKTGPDEVAFRIYGYINDSQYAKALALGNRRKFDRRFKSHTIFWLNYAFAYMMAKPGITKQASTPVYLCRKHASKHPMYSKSLEASMWYTYQATAARRGNFKVAIRMLEWALELNPSSRVEMIEKTIALYRKELAKQQGKKPRRK